VRLFSFDTSRGPALGILDPLNHQRFLDLHDIAPDLPRSLEMILAGHRMAHVRAAFQQAQGNASAPWQALSADAMRPLLSQPGKIICVGLNYADHAKEGGNARPEYPSFFLRTAASLVAHGAAILRPRVSDRLDFEAELAVVIGQRVKHATLENALDAVAGYSCFNDGSLRDYQRKTSQWTIGKNFDFTGGFGPCLVTPDELPAGAKGLRIRSILNGQTMQDSTTTDMLWGVAELIVILSECMTLEPGDVIASGTPAGVGYARTPPVFMHAGDVIEIEIEGVGCLSNPIADEK
jgi:acylpyruvate hydrolase